MRSWNWGDQVKLKSSCCALSETRDWEHEVSFGMLAMVLASSQVANIRRFRKSRCCSIFVSGQMRGILSDTPR
jgi:hypothetical protein